MAQTVLNLVILTLYLIKPSTQQLESEDYMKREHSLVSLLFYQFFVHYQRASYYILCVIYFMTNLPLFLHSCTG